MKRILELIVYLAALIIMLYAGIQLSRPPVVRAVGSACCKQDSDCGPNSVCQSCGINCCGIDGWDCGSIGIQ